MTVYSKIIGTGSYLPARRVSNDELAAELAAKGIETSDEWIVSRSGISARHYAAAGIPTVLYGAGPRSILEANAHGADEHLRLADLRAATEVVALTLAELLQTT